MCIGGVISFENLIYILLFFYNERRKFKRQSL
nr:MAG TPA: hypothetical protein [Caudoviricetes sp.]